MNQDWLLATNGGDVERTLELLHGGADVDALDRHGQTALMNAAHRGDTAMARALIASGAKLDHTAKFRLTAVMLAVIANRPQIVALLVSAGANLDIKGNRGTFNCTPAEYAEANGQSQLLSILRGGADQRAAQLGSQPLA
jgi:ankyrin repeat protein